MRVLRGRCIASQWKNYAGGVMAVEVQQVDQNPDVDLVFTEADLRDVIPHDNDQVVISLVTAGRKVHRVLVDQGSSTDVMFLTTLNQLQLSTDKLRHYTRWLYGFAGDQVEVLGHIELRTTFIDGTTSRTTNIRYLVVNAPSAYNILLGRPALNRIRVWCCTTFYYRATVRHKHLSFSTYELWQIFQSVWPLLHISPSFFLLP